MRRKKKYRITIFIKQDKDETNFRYETKPDMEMAEVLGFLEVVKHDILRKRFVERESEEL